VLELFGQSCMPQVMAPPPKQQIACTRSFGRPVTDLAPLVEAVSHFAQRAAEKLRAQPPCWCLRTAARSGPTIPRFSECATVLVAAAERGMRKIYRPGYRLAKAGVMLLNLSPQTRDQPSLLPEEAAPTGRDHSALMEAMDRINQRWGKGAVAVGSAVQVGAWGMRQERRTGMCANQLDQVLVACGKASLASRHACRLEKTGKIDCSPGSNRSVTVIQRPKTMPHRDQKSAL